jgi:pimeloyl-ACP methyl ester carboxylesterase
VKARVGDIDIAYDRAGSGDSVLLIMGIGTVGAAWFMQMDGLSHAHDVVCFDNRGVGDSSVPEAAWTLADMAADAVGLADALGWRRFHLCGVSMGGMIAQEVALGYGDRLRSLTLISTMHGGPDAIQAPPETLQAFATSMYDMEPILRLNFGRRFAAEHPDWVDHTVAVAARPTPLGGMNQGIAVGIWANGGGTQSRLGEISVPTLVLHGGDDNLVPGENGKLLADAIPGSRFRFWPDAGHALILEHADEVNAELLAHFVGR